MHIFKLDFFAFKKFTWEKSKRYKMWGKTNQSNWALILCFPSPSAWPQNKRIHWIHFGKVHFRTTFFLFILENVNSGHLSLNLHVQFKSKFKHQSMNEVRYAVNFLLWDYLGIFPKRGGGESSQFPKLFNARNSP